LRIRQVLFMAIAGLMAVVVEVGFFNKLTYHHRIIDLLVIMILYTMLFVDITPAIFLIIWLSYLRDIFTGQYSGVNIMAGLILYSVFLLLREKLNEEDKYFQMLFTFIIMILWIVLVNIVIMGTGLRSFDIIIKVMVNAIIAPFIFQLLRRGEKGIENVFERLRI